MARSYRILLLLLIGTVAGCTIPTNFELPHDCDDGVSCTDDSRIDGNCSNVPNDVNCDNGLYCDGAETCDIEDGCQAGAAPETDDGMPCTEDVCDEESDSVFNYSVSIANVSILDVFRNQISSVAVGEQVLVAADLMDNNCGTETAFAYVVDIVDPSGETTTRWVTGSLAPGQSFTPSLSWNPNSEGTHEVTASVRQHVEGMTPDAWPRISSQLSIPVQVE